MTNEEFQKLVLEQLSGLRSDITEIKQRQLNTEAWQKNMDVWKENTEAWQKNMEARLSSVEVQLTNVEVRQDEVYQIVKAIEHSNQVRKAELDNHEYKIAKLEGKFKAAGKIFDADEVDAVSNL